MLFLAGTSDRWLHCDTLSATAVVVNHVPALKPEADMHSNEWSNGHWFIDNVAEWWSWHEESHPMLLPDADVSYNSFATQRIFPPHSLIHNYISYYKQVTTTNQNVLWIPQQVPFWYTCMCRTLFVANLCRVWIWYRTRRVWVFSLGRHRIIERTLLFYRLLYSQPQKAFHNFDRIVSYWKLRPFFFCCCWFTFNLFHFYVFWKSQFNFMIQ